MKMTQLNKKTTVPTEETRYFREMATHPLLTPDEERTLTQQLAHQYRIIRTLIKETRTLAKTLPGDEPVQASLQTLSQVVTAAGFSHRELDAIAITLDVLMQHVRTKAQKAQLTAAHRTLRTAITTLAPLKERLVAANLRLVINNARRYMNKGLDLLDLIQEGNLGLMHATERFQVKKNYRFTTYATWWIRQHIMRALSDQSRTIRIPVHMNDARSQLDRIALRLKQQLGRLPTSAEIAAHTVLTTQKVELIQQAFQIPASLDAPVLQTDDLPLADCLIDRETPTPEDVYMHKETHRLIDRLLHTLTPKEQHVITHRFGLKGVDRHTLEQVGQAMHLTRERIRQIEKKGLGKLIAYAKRHQLHLETDHLDAWSA